MEEINIFLNNSNSIFYLSLFDTTIKDENNFKIGDYLFINQDLQINYTHGIQTLYYFKKEENNIKFFIDNQQIETNILNNKINNINKINNEINNKINKINIIHKDWTDELILNYETNQCYRQSNNDYGNYQFNSNSNSLTIHWINYDKEEFEQNPLDNHYYLIQLINQSKQNDEYQYEYQNHNQQTQEIELENIQTIFIKNFTWENNIELNPSTLICIRQNNTKDKGTYIINNNYLTIKWDLWDEEIFYKVDNIYYNNKKFIDKMKIITENNEEIIEYDKEYVYISNKSYKYKNHHKYLYIEDYIYNEFIFLDNEYYSLFYFTKVIYNDEYYFIFNQDNSILNNKYIIIGQSTKINNNILNINWYFKENNYYLLNNEQSTIFNLYCLKEIILESNEQLTKYYINLDLHLHKNIILDENFNETLFFDYDFSQENKIIINQLTYINTNPTKNIFNLEINSENSQLNELKIIENDDLLTLYYNENNSNSNFNSNSNISKLSNNKISYDCLIDDDFKYLYIKKLNKVVKYKKLLENHKLYIEENNLSTSTTSSTTASTITSTTTNLNHFNEFNSSIFSYFENDETFSLSTINQIKKNEIIYSQSSFNNNYVFLEDLSYIFNNKNYDIFEHYGYFIIIENEIKNMNNEITILNLNKNEDFMKNQDEWLDYFENNQNMILIFDDFSYYEFLNTIINFKETCTNYLILINYSKSSLFLHIYLNKLLNNLLNINSIIKLKELSKINFITNIKDKIKQIKKQNSLIMNDDFIKTIYSKIDLIIFMIYFYIKNKNILTFNNQINFTINYENYKKIII